MAKKAVLVGCNYPGTKAELHGCINDVRRIHTSLLDRFQFQQDNIIVLVDTDRTSTQPTGANIKRALNKLVDDSQPGDVLFFHYSGHGVRLPAETGEDDDTGYDECIVPCDMNLITDDDFREIVDKVPNGVKLTLVSDSCHSGGLVNNAKEQIGESSQHRGTVTAERESGLKDFISDSIHGALEDRGIYLPSFGHGHGHRHGGSRHLRYLEEDEKYQRVPYEGRGTVKSRALPVSTFVEMLKQQTGKQDVDVGTIRPTLFDVFGEDSSAKVKKFVKVLLQKMNDGEGNASGHGGGLVGAVGALAMEFLKQKLNDSDNSDEYVKPALEAAVPSHGVAYAGTHAQTTGDRGILLSGCQSSETSADANPSGKPHEAYGAMSNAVQTALSECDGPITNHDLVMRVRQILKKEGFVQHPGLYCSDEKVSDIFIC